MPTTLEWRLAKAKRALRRVRARLSVARWSGDAPTLAHGRVCVLATYSADGRIAERTRRLAEAWQAEGFDVVLVVATGVRAALRLDAIRPCVVGVLVRANHGYDFGSWGDALRALPALREARLLALANDSVYGPVGNFAAMLRAVDASTADIVAMTDSWQVAHHVQSYLVFWKPRALQSDAFARFWNVRRAGDRQETIDEAEIPLMSRMRDAGLEVDVLYPTPRGEAINPTLVRWRELLDAGFPFVKVQLLRENPAKADLEGWDARLRAGRYDPAIVTDELGTVRLAS